MITTRPIIARDWREATRRKPCIACGSDHYCGATADGALVRCMKQGDPPASYKLVRVNADGGKLFGRITPAIAPPRAPRRHGPPSAQACSERTCPTIDWTGKQKRYQLAATYQRVEQLGYWLGVTIESLRGVGCGYCESRDCYTFAERDGEGRIIGLSTRTIDGVKRFIGGGKRGLTIPDSFTASSTDPLLLVEGVTDVCACITLGTMALGRPSNCGGAEHLGHLLRGYVGEIFVVGERDAKPDGRWPGREGAESIARQLANRLNRAVKWTLPTAGHKDIRAWLEAHDAHLTEDLRSELL